jgi:hypothetical protein
VCSLEDPAGKAVSTFEFDFNEPYSVLLRGDNGKVAVPAQLGPTEISFVMQGERGAAITRIDRAHGVLAITLENTGSLGGHCHNKDGGAVSF